MRTDGVHCREYTGTGPVFPKAVPETGAAFSGFLTFSTPTVGMQYSTVGVCDIESIRGGWLPVEQGLRQRWVLEPLLFNILFAAFINVAYTRVMADKDIVDALVHLFAQWCSG